MTWEDIIVGSLFLWFLYGLFLLAEHYLLKKGIDD